MERWGVGVVGRGNMSSRVKKGYRWLGSGWERQKQVEPSQNNFRITYLNVGIMFPSHPKPHSDRRSNHSDIIDRK